MRYTTLILILLAGTANAETFKCRAGSIWELGDDIVVVATINENGVGGTIKVAGVTYTAFYHVTGFDRRWDFGSDGESFDYSFVLKPDGTGMYFDFTTSETGKNVSSSQIFSCK